MNVIKAPEGKFTGICKIIDIVLVVVMVAVFALSLFTYFDFTEGQVINPEGTEFTIENTDSFSLLAYCGFPENHDVVNDYYKEVYGEKTVSIKQVGMILFLDVFAILGVLFMFLKKGMARDLFVCLWGIIGALGFTMNHFMLMGNTWVKPASLGLCVAAAVIGLVGTVLYAIDTKNKYAYLRSVSAAYK